MKTSAVLPLAVCLFSFLFFLLPLQSMAQEGSYPELSEKFSREALTQMLAPIALYPDVLLTQILMASTYPVEVTEADLWVRKHSELTGTDLDARLLDKDWAPSVKALCHFPAVLSLMKERITETTNIGNAFLSQEQEVMDVIQELREKAYAEGNLVSTFEQEIIVDREKIKIEPADPRVIYVPYYDTFFIYGPWLYPDCPPYSWAPGRVKTGRRIMFWPLFYSGFSFGTWSYFDWHRHHIFIDAFQRPRFVKREHWITQPGPWNHIPRHRRGVPYRDKHTAGKYGQYPYSPRDYRQDSVFPENPDRNQFQIPSRVVPLDDHRSRFQFPDRNMPWDDDSIPDRDQLEREHADRDRQHRQRMDRERKERERVEQERKERERIEREKRERERAREEEELLLRKKAERERQLRERSEKERLEQPERNRQMRRQIEQERLERQGYEGERQERESDKVFNQVEEGRRERQSTERGRATRREEKMEDSRSRGGIKRDGSDSRGDREFILR